MFPNFSEEMKADELAHREEKIFFEQSQIKTFI